MAKEKILCVYATRQVDSNLMMASTVFRGFSEAGIEADMVFVGSDESIAEFRGRYERYFHRVFYHSVCQSMKRSRLFRKKPLLYSYLRHFALDYLDFKWLKRCNLLICKRLNRGGVLQDSLIRAAGVFGRHRFEY